MPTVIAEKIPVTVIVPVRKEDVQLAELLPLLQDFARVIVVESGDDHATRQLAEANGADFVVFDWRGGYPKKRTWATRTCQIRTPWVLYLDADERPTTAFVAELRSSLPRAEAAGFWLTYDTVFLGQRLRFGIPQRKLALVRDGAGEYERIDDPGWTDLDMEVHEHLVVQGPTGAIRSRLIHLDAKTIEAYVRRHGAYATWEAGRYDALRSDSARWADLTMRQRLKYRLLATPIFPLIYLGLQYVARLGFLDGANGLRFALLKAGYFSEVGAKIAEQRQRTSRSPSQQSAVRDPA
jgi:glycosyltransferase involved in cell wall biosynthesis